MAQRHDTFREDARFKILRMLEECPESSQRDIADALGISLGGVNYCLRALIAKGHVKVSNFRKSDRKLRYAYALTPSGIAERTLLTGKFLKRKMMEFDAIKAEIAALTGEMPDMPDEESNPAGTRRPERSR